MSMLGSQPGGDGDQRSDVRCPYGGGHRRCRSGRKAPVEAGPRKLETRMKARGVGTDGGEGASQLALGGARQWMYLL